MGARPYGGRAAREEHGRPARGRGDVGRRCPDLHQRRARPVHRGLGRYQLHAAINAVHTNALSARDTDWSTIVALYGRMVLLDPSPIVRLNRAVAVAEVDGPGVGLAEIDRLAEVLDGYHAFHAARADLLRRLGRSGESRAAYDPAIELAGNPAERAYLTRRRDQLAG